MLIDKRTGRRFFEGNILGSEWYLKYEEHMLWVDGRRTAYAEKLRKKIIRDYGCKIRDGDTVWFPALERD